MITIVTIPISEGGKPYYRLKQPLDHLNNTEDDFWLVERCPQNFRLTQNDLDKMDVLYLNGIHPDILYMFTKIKKTEANVKLVYDIDDYDWEIPEYHPVHKQYKEQDVKSLIQNITSTADTVISSTPNIKNGLIDEFGKSSKSEVVRIAIDYDYHYWNLKQNRDTINIGWIGGSAHKEDLKLIQGIGSWVLNNFRNTKFVLGGWSSRVQTDTRKNIYHEGKYNIWVQYKNILFNKPCNKKRIKILRSKPPYLYPQMFSHVDILLVPLVENPYNTGKSRIKLVEASAYNIPTITSNVEPYNEVIENEENGLLVNNKLNFEGTTVNNTQGWKDAITKLIEKEKLRKQIGKNLRETIKPIHNIEYQNKKRKQILKETMKK